MSHSSDHVKVVCQLTDAEIEYVIGVGRRRQDANKLTKEQRKGAKTAEECHIQGASGEFAFCKLMTCDFDETIGQRTKGDVLQSDTFIYGYSIDVKTYTYNGSDAGIIVPKIKNSCDVYVMMIGNIWKGATFEFVGWTFDTILLRPENYNAAQKIKSAYFLPRGRLFGPHTLLASLSAYPKRGNRSGQTKTNFG